MAKWQVRKISDGSLGFEYEAEESRQAEFGGPWGNPNDYQHLEVPEGLDPRALKVEDGELVEDEDKLDDVAEMDMAALRVERNNRLDACDWTQLSDSPLTANKKGQWATYRQELRDLPENTSDPKNPEWPEEP